MSDYKPIIGILKYGFYEQDIFKKERKEFRRTLRRIFKNRFGLKVKDSEIVIECERCHSGAVNRRNPTVKLSYKQNELSFTKEELNMLYSYAYSNKFSDRFHPLEFFDYIRRPKISEEEKAIAKKKKRKWIVNGKCEYCGNTDMDRTEYWFVKNKMYHKCTACK